MYKVKTVVHAINVDITTYAMPLMVAMGTTPKLVCKLAAFNVGI